MLGIRKKVLLGFVAIGFILLLSGVISVFEMTRMATSISGLLSDNVKSMDAAKAMERLLYKQNKYVYDWAENNIDFRISELMADTASFEKQRQLASNNITVKGEDTLINKLQQAYSSYKKVLDSLSVVKNFSESERKNWYSVSYRGSFYPLANTIMALMDINQEALAANSSRLEKNYYRMIMPGIIAISAGILLIIFFNYFLNRYIVAPILRIKKGINAFLSSRVPYSVKVDTQDEIDKLNEQVKTLTELLKKKETKDNQ